MSDFYAKTEFIIERYEIERYEIERETFWLDVKHLLIKRISTFA